MTSAQNWSKTAYPGDILGLWWCPQATNWYVFPLQFNSEYTVQIDTNLESANEYP